MFESARLKVERAREHLAALEAEVRPFVDSNPYRLVSEHDPESGRVVMRVRYNDPGLAVPPRLGLLAGDVAHSLRCALDHVIWEWAEAGSGAGERSAFPIFHSRAQYERHSVPLLRGLNEWQSSLVEALQPYHVRQALDAGETHFRRELVYLLLVARLDDIDKHRRIHTSRPVLYWREPQFSSNVISATVEYGPDPALMDEGAVAFVITDLVSDGPDVRIESDAPYTMVFGEPDGRGDNDWWSDRSRVAGSLADLREAVELVAGIIDQFEQATARN